MEAEGEEETAEGDTVREAVTEAVLDSDKEGVTDTVLDTDNEGVIEIVTETEGDTEVLLD